MQLDYLFFGAHPDDVELACAGTILKERQRGKKIGIVDLTRGELGSRGSAALRDQEAAVAARILGVEIRENLRFRDGFFQEDEAHKIPIIRMIRKYKPCFVFVNAKRDRHPDHGRTSRLVTAAVFLAGLRKIATEYQGVIQTEWRPNNIFYYIQDKYLLPDFVVDISGFFEQKMQVVQAYASQFFSPNYTSADGPDTYISTPDFLVNLEMRTRQMGQLIGTAFGEGYQTEKMIGLDNMDAFLRTPF